MTVPTIVEVARAAGVSTATVSNALNGTGRVGTATAERVRAVATQLGYRPNAAGRTLRTGRTGVLGFAVTTYGAHAWNFAEYAYYAHMVAAATSAAHARGYALMVLPPGLDAEGWHGVAVDGVVLVDSPRDDPAVAVLRQRGVPVVFDGEPDEPVAGDSWVDNDHAAVVRQVVAHLRDQGARRIGLLVPSSDDHYARASVAAYEELVGQPLVAVVPRDDPDAAAAAGELLDRGADALYGLIDRCGRGSLLAAAERGLRVPDDVLVVSVSEDPMYAATSPPVSTVSLSPVDTVTAALDALVATLAGQGPTVRSDLPAELVVRTSSTRG